MGSLRLISLNVERSKHLDRIVPFVKKQEPDVFCAQELSEPDYVLFQEMFRYASPFVPLSHHTEAGESSTQGICIFSNISMRSTRVRYYAGDPSFIPKTIAGQVHTYMVANRALLFATLEKNESVYRVGTTHFTWSEKGKATNIQRSHLQSLLSSLEPEQEFILCGDFNMPRGGELFSILAEKYKDNIPPEYKTSIDLGLHRNRLENPEELSEKMVDGLFTTPEYRAHDVRLVSGVSDHMAVVATVEKIVT